MEGGGAGIPHLQQSHSPHHQDHHLHHHLHQQHHPHDEDFLEQMLSTIPSCTWPPQPHDHPDDHSPPPPSAAAFQYPFDEAFNAGNNGHGFAPGSIHGNGQPPLSQPRGQFHPPPPPPPPQSFGAGVAGAAAGPPASASTGGSSGATPQKQSRVRARRGQATDPHSIAERLRRERIAERMKALQELVPNANKTDKASMLDEIIDYVKFLQLQVKVVSMSRLGGAAAGLGPLVADMSAEGNGGRRSNIATTPTALTANNNMTATENQVARLMEEDMGSAMQYLQGKGLCLMPISLATAISTAACSSRNPPPPRTHITNNDNNNNNKVVNNTPNVDQPTTTMATASALVVDNSINDGSKK